MNLTRTTFRTRYHVAPMIAVLVLFVITCSTMTWHVLQADSYQQSCFTAGGMLGAPLGECRIDGKLVEP